MDEELIHRTLNNLNNETIDETLLDELQAKVCFLFAKNSARFAWNSVDFQVFEILSSSKYYGQFKATPQYLKVLSEIDFTESLNDNNSGSKFPSEILFFKIFFSA